MSTPLLEELAADSSPGLMPLTVDQFEQMIATGILADGDPIELIDGLMVWKDRGSNQDVTVHTPLHAGTVARIALQLQRLVAFGLHVRCQLPIILDERNAPEPDVALVSGTVETFLERHPTPPDIHLLIEVSDSSLRYDRTTKQRLYASAEIPTYWIVNLTGQKLEVFQKPDSVAGVYRETATFDRTGTVQLSLPGGSHPVAVADLL